MRITVAWELSWYQWGVDIGDELRPVFEIDKGRELDQLDAAARQWNASVGEDGRLRLAGERAASDEPGHGQRRRGRPRQPRPGGDRRRPPRRRRQVLEEVGEKIGEATNNVAEYRALLRGIELAAAHGATELELIGDSELVVRQVEGALQSQKRRDERAARRGEAGAAGLRLLVDPPRAPRENADADRLVNEALDGVLDG